jgi:hypothetical protein
MPRAAICRAKQWRLSPSAAWSFGQEARTLFLAVPFYDADEGGQLHGRSRTLMLAHAEAVSEKKNVAGPGLAIVG